MDYFDGCFVMALSADLGFLGAKLILFAPVSNVPMESLTSMVDFSYAIIAIFSASFVWLVAGTSRFRRPRSYRICFFFLLTYLIVMQYIQNYSIAASLVSSITFYFLANELIRHLIFWLDGIHHCKGKFEEDEKHVKN